MTDAPAPPAPQPGILLVDDERMSRVVNAAMLRRQGWTVTVADGGAAAVEAAARTRFALVLLDLRMPGLDGIAVVRRIRALPDAERARVPVVMLTASMVPDDARAALAAGADGVLTKPLRWEEVRPLLEGLGLEPGSEPAPAAAADAPPLSDAPLRQMLDLLPAAQVAGLLATAGRSLQTNGDALAGAWAAGDRDRVRDLAHRLSGVGGTYGCMALRSAAQALERAAAGSDADPTPLVDAVLRLIGPAVAFLSERREELAAASPAPPDRG